MIYVISDTPKLKSSFAKNSACFELRSILHNKKKFVITSDNKIILDYVKHKNDNFVVTTIESSLLKNYCVGHNKGVLHVSRCFCDILTKKEICHMEEYHFETNNPKEIDAYLGAGDRDREGTGVGDEDANFLFK